MASSVEYLHLSVIPSSHLSTACIFLSCLARTQACLNFFFDFLQIWNQSLRDCWVFAQGRVGGWALGLTKCWVGAERAAFMGHWCWEGISFPGLGRKTAQRTAFFLCFSILWGCFLFYECIFWELPGKCLPQMEMEISELRGMKTFGSELTEWKEDYQPAILWRAKQWSKVCRASPKVIGFPQEGNLWTELNELNPIPFPTASGESSATFNLVGAQTKWGTFQSRYLGNSCRASVSGDKRIHGFVAVSWPDRTQGKGGSAVFLELLEEFWKEDGLLEQMQMARFLCMV